MIGAERMAELLEEQSGLGIPLEERMRARGIDWDELVAIAEETSKLPGPRSVLFTTGVEIGYLCALEEISKAPDPPEAARG